MPFYFPLKGLSDPQSLRTKEIALERYLNQTSGTQQAQPGSETAPGYSFTTETNTGWYLEAAGKMAASILGTKRADLTASGLSLQGTKASNVEACRYRLAFRDASDFWDVSLRGDSDGGGDLLFTRYDGAGWSGWLRFDVSESVFAFAKTLRVTSGSPSKPAVAWSSEANTGLYWSQSGKTSFASLGNLTARFGHGVAELWDTGSGMYQSFHRSGTRYGYVGVPSNTADSVDVNAEQGALNLSGKDLVLLTAPYVSMAEPGKPSFEIAPRGTLLHIGEELNNNAFPSAWDYVINKTLPLEYANQPVFVLLWATVAADFNEYGRVWARLVVNGTPLNGVTKMSAPDSVTAGSHRHADGSYSAGGVPVTGYSAYTTPSATISSMRATSPVIGFKSVASGSSIQFGLQCYKEGTVNWPQHRLIWMILRG